jgi:hypothetical protein
VHGEAWPDGPDLKSNADSGATGAQDASLESASLESGGTKQRAHEAARTLRAEEITECVEAWPGGPDFEGQGRLRGHPEPEMSAWLEAQSGVMDDVQGAREVT